MDSNWQNPFPNGSVVVFRCSKAVSIIIILRQQQQSLVYFYHITLVDFSCLFSYLAAENLVRTDPAKHGEGFFIALFAKKDANLSERSDKNDNRTLHGSTKTRYVRRRKPMLVHTNLFRMWLYGQLNQRRTLDKSYSSSNPSDNRAV
jgi:hypothetical protein